MPSFIEYPQVNGHRFSHQSIEFKWVGLLLLGVSELNYDDELVPGELYGTDPRILGRTRGKQKANASITLFELEWEIVRPRLGVGGQGFGETAHDIRVVMAEPGAPVVTRTILAPRVMKVGRASSSGSADGLSVKLDLHVMAIQEGSGRHQIAAPRKVGI